ncbi:MAG: hypothetical protein LBG11_05025, partial [Bifidobacteriaceae bacterium]|nr:hypothetical protein [Bifidobacteriaceae bacterium]
ARLKVRSGETFQAESQSDGRIVLTPVVTIPARELMVWENPGLRTSLLTAMTEAAAGLAAVDQEMEEDLASLNGAD